MERDEEKSLSFSMTRGQYRTLLEMLALGAFMTSRQTSRPDLIESGAELLEYLVSFHRDLDCGDWIELDDEDGIPVLKPDFLRELGPMVEEYNAIAFREDLGRSLAERDLEERLSKRELKKMDRDEYIARREILKEQYIKELDKRGVKRLRLVDLTRKGKKTAAGKTKTKTKAVKRKG